MVEYYPLRKERTDYGKAIRKQYESHLVYEKRSNMTKWSLRKDNISNTITTVQKDTWIACIERVKEMSKKLVVRKLTPIECFKLMGFTKEDAEKCYAVGLSDSALYRAAGNSICVPCIKLLFQHLFKSQEDNNYICEDEIMNGKKND